MDVVLEVKNLKTYFSQDGGTVRAVDGVSFQVYQGETVGIVGESGCGKTVTTWTVMRLIPENGRIVEGEILLHPRSGERQEVQDIVHLDPDGAEMCFIRGGRIGMIFQEPMTTLSPVHTVGNQIMEAILLHEKQTSATEARVRAVDLLRKAGIPRADQIVDAYPHQLSGGMRQRAMIAIALACNPELLIADEPTTALDVTIQAQILKLMRDLQRDFGMSIIFITHDMGVIAEMADRVLVMYLGRIVESGPVEEIFYNPRHPYTQALLKSIPSTQQAAKTRLESITGSIPSPYAVIKGCPFADRCAQRMPVCDTTPPATWSVGESHTAACHLYREGAGE